MVNYNVGSWATSILAWRSRLLGNSCTHVPPAPTPTPTLSSHIVDPRKTSGFIFPKNFILPDLLSIIAPVFEYRTSEHEESGKIAGRDWFHSFAPMEPAKIDRFLEKGNFARFAAMSFPQADLERFTVGFEFYIWAFMIDDAWDEGGLSDANTAEHTQVSVQACWDVLDYNDPADARPTHPFAKMLQSLCVSMRKTGSPGACKRFATQFKAWSGENVEQARRRSRSFLPSVNEYIDIRRKTIGQGAVEAILEYITNVRIPDHVFEHPTMVGLSNAAADILTWPNDLCSFNKEQADGDYQNFICVLMHERGLDLQGAVYALTNMIAQRVRDYARLKASLPSFGAEVDVELAKYLAELEHETYASVRWYYESPRYWRGNVEIHQELVIEVFPRKQSASISS